jgi:hypothetical protein
MITAYELSRGGAETYKAKLRRFHYWKMLTNPLAGLAFLRRSYNGRVVLAYRHWPHLLCWSWYLAWSGTPLPLLQSSSCGRFRSLFQIEHGEGFFGIQVWRLYFGWQSYPHIATEFATEAADYLNSNG